ncbi:hypothetical protein EZS27_025443 [termite gut metagenome]|uniref:Uncharacterized protein n=1 Tax=termite gut metagenome TaxID=433724 RepID=A0A5J4QXA6_9ZZZZ
MSTLQIFLIVTFLLIGIRKVYKKSKAEQEQVDNPNQTTDSKPSVYPNVNASMKMKRSNPKSVSIYTDTAMQPATPHSVLLSQSQTFPDSSFPELESETDYTIHSLEDAKRAIIWSEVFQQKY